MAETKQELMKRPTLDMTVEAWQTMKEQADMLVKTGFLPQAIDTPEKAIAIMLRGRELGIPPMEALSKLYVVKGRVTCMGELMLSLIHSHHAGEVNILESSEKIARVRMRRKEDRQWDTFIYTIEAAAKAGLTSGPNAGSWKKFPEQMLLWRVIAKGARIVFPDVIGGMYTPEEAGLTVRVEEDEVALNGDGQTVAEAEEDTDAEASVEVKFEVVDQNEDLFGSPNFDDNTTDEPESQSPENGDYLPVNLDTLAANTTKAARFKHINAFNNWKKKHEKELKALPRDNQQVQDFFAFLTDKKADLEARVGTAPSLEEPSDE